MSEEQPTVEKAENPYRKPFLVLVGIICLSLIAQAVGSGLTWGIARNTNKIVSDVNFRSSPAGRAQQDEATAQVILRVDCNSRRAMEEALNQISVENPGLDFSISLVGEECKNLISTTTTSVEVDDGG